MDLDNAKRAATTALYHQPAPDNDPEKRNRLLQQAYHRDIDPARLWIIGYAKAVQLVEEDRAPDQGYLVVSARNAMYVALRRIYAVDSQSRTVTWDDEELHDFLRPVDEEGNRPGRYHTVKVFRQGKRTKQQREWEKRKPSPVNLSDEGFQAANELLTPKERKVVDGVFRGWTQTEIAEDLGHGQPWVSKLVRRIIRKLAQSGNKELRTLGIRLAMKGRETRKSVQIGRLLGDGYPRVFNTFTTMRKPYRRTIAYRRDTDAI